ncbi:MAG: rhomboid family intramembrane serine protease [Gemmatimonadetes bacterium]|nr:rhomboid family intramembrane serine protease [Gemmatimonadota bacterium]
MFPIRDDNPHFLTPYATYGLIAANVVAWVLIQGLGSEPQLAASVCRYGLIPGDVLGTAPPGSSFPVGPGLACVLEGDGGWHTAFTSMFLHGGWLHLIGNMWFLWIFGNNVEDAMGHVRFVVFYLLSGLGAAALQTATDPDSVIPMVGASGAIGGVMGAYVLMYPRVHVHLLVVLGFYVTTFAVPAVFMLGYWFLLQFLGGWTAAGGGGGVAFWAHVGGFVAGAVLSLVFRDRAMLARHPHYGWNRKSPTESWHRVRR